ncbi:thiamine pyrophosphate-dependent enzyme [Nocardioides speluncae]|uniref:thiamine pyrophosphate-dependent enzyme n=1 Tax=Nocardioides speluncae TaxID=2670337 RepID=UPI000D687D62|nr:thiamine pyrophosphate-dependent enzyme [Nocardioides speluncae]
METIDEHFVRVLRAQSAGSASRRTGADTDVLLDLFEAQAQSRHLDFAARWLQSQGKGHYTIGSAGHEGNAALGLLSRVDDPALLHYRSGGFYAARAARAGRGDAVRDVLASLTSARSDPMSGGRHKVFGHPGLNIIPQTSTIGSHPPRAVGLAYALDLSRVTGVGHVWPVDAVVLCSFGDASANHSTVTGALNAAAYLRHRAIPCPVLFVCEDNGIGISTRSPSGWPAAALQRLPGLRYWEADGADPESLLSVVSEALASVRESRQPGVLHLRTVRFMGHAGSDTEIAYRSRSEILADYARDPVLHTALALVRRGAMSPTAILERYETVRRTVMDGAKQALDEEQLASREAVMAPLTLPARTSVTHRVTQESRLRAWRGRLPEDGPPMTLAQAVNATLTDLMCAHPEALVFGEDVAVKGGVYGVTRGLRKRFGGHRVFDTLLDEQTVLGTALGTALAGYVPMPEIQYLAYLHNAEDQLRGEAASLRFFSDGQYQNGMVVRVAGLAYQRGFGGHFHNDNSVSVLRDIPGLLLAVPSHPEVAPGLLRTCFHLAREDGRVCVFLEPIARYHTRDLLEAGDGEWTASYPAPNVPSTPLGEIGRYGDGRDVLLVTFGNGVHLSRRAAMTLAGNGVESTVLDLRWLAPLPVEALTSVADEFAAVLVVDETRHSGGVSEGVVAALVDAGYQGRLSRVTSADSFIPLGPAAETVLLGESDIVNAVHELLDTSRPPGTAT